MQKGITTTVIAIIIACLVVAGLGGFFGWKAWQTKKETQKLAKEAEEIAKKAEEEVLPEEEVIEVMDTDNDGLTDEEEAKLGTDPNKADTDGDGYSDKTEVDTGHDPLKPAEKPTQEEVKKEEIADWKTYKNDAYGYQIDYPASWSYKESVPQPQNFGVLIDFSDLDGKHILSIQNPLPEIGYEAWKITSIDKIKIQKSEKYLTKKVLEDITGGLDNLILVTWSEDEWEKSGQITLGYKDKNDPNIKILDQMLASFKLTKSAEDKLTKPQEEKTYSSAKNNITFKYPKDWEIHYEGEYKSPPCQADPACQGLYQISLAKTGSNGCQVIQEGAKCIVINETQVAEGEVPLFQELSGGNIIVAYSEDSEVKDAFQKIVSTFEITE